MLRGLSHKNILSVMSVCLEGKPMVIFPYMNLGNLKQFLRNGRIGPGDTHQVSNIQGKYISYPRYLSNRLETVKFLLSAHENEA